MAVLYASCTSSRASVGRDCFHRSFPPAGSSASRYDSESAAGALPYRFCRSFRMATTYSFPRYRIGLELYPNISALCPWSFSRSRDQSGLPSKSNANRLPVP